MKKSLVLLVAGWMTASMAMADAVPSNELFATYQKQGDIFYRGNTAIDTENPDARALDVNYYIVTCGQKMLFRATNPGGNINFGGAGWETQLRVHDTNGGAMAEVQACSAVDAHNHYTGEGCQTAFPASTEDLQVYFFLSSNVEGGYRITNTFDFNRASINNPIEDNVAPVITPEAVTMTEEGGNLIFTFGDVTADDEYFYYVGDKDHHLGGISLTNTVTIVKPTVMDGITYTFECCAVDYNGNKSAAKSFVLSMPFDPAVDLALNKPCAASAVQGANSPEKAVNGDPDSFWTSFAQTADDYWWKVDLGAKYDIDSIMIHFNDIWGAYSIYLSDDEQVWTAIAANQEADNNSVNSFANIGAAGRYVKVTCPVSQIGIREFEVYATGLSASDTESTGIESDVLIDNDAAKSCKRIVNGQLLIIRDGRAYNAQGVCIQ